LREEEKTKEMIAENPELKELAEEELSNLNIQKEALEKQIEEILKKEEEEEEFPNEIVLEVRAGAGGDEASLFAYELAEMYLKFAENKGWQTKKLGESINEVGGYKEASF